MKKIMQHHPRIRGAVIAIVLIFSNFATSAYAWSDGKVPEITVTGHPDKDKDWKPDGGEVALPSIGLPTGFTVQGVYGPAYTYTAPTQNSSMEPPLSCEQKKLIPGTNPATSHPVVIATGEKVKVERDFIAATPTGLSLERTYRSKSKGGKLFGPNWVAAFEYPDLILGSDSVTVTDQTGAQYTLSRLAPPPGGFPGGSLSTPARTVN